MNRKDFVTVIYDRRNRVRVTGEGTVELNIYLSRNERKYVPVRLCTPLAWRKYQKSEELRQEVTIYRQAIERMMENHDELTIDNLNRYMGISLTNKEKVEKQKKINSRNGFIDFMEEEIAKESISPATLTRKHVTIDALKRYKKIRSFKDLTPERIKGFDEFLHEECERTLQTCHNYHKIVKMYTRMAFQLRYIASDPYDHPLCHFERGKYKERRPLTEEELISLRDLELDGKLARVRDLFIFCAYTGLSYADSQIFDFKTMTDTHEGKVYIDGKRVKTGNTYFTPILPPAMDVLVRYGFVLPHISNQKANDFLHVIESKMELNKPMTMHVARHSFATLMLSYGIPIESVARMCGHADIKTTQVYAIILKSTIHKNVDVMLDHLK